MIKDRGTKKWTSIMIPELITDLQHAFYEDANRTDKPIIDEYQQAEFDESICYAMEYNYPVEFTLWIKGYTETVKGNVHFVDYIQKHFRLKQSNGDLAIVKMNDIIRVKVYE